MSNQQTQNMSMLSSGLVSNHELNTILLGAYQVSIGKPNTNQSPLTIQLDDRVLFSAPKTAQWLVGYSGGYHLPESRGFFSPKPTQTSGIDAGYATHVEQSSELIRVRGRNGVFEWSVGVQLSHDHAVCLSIVTNMERVLLTSSRNTPGRVFGLGHQFTHVNLDGKRVPIISQEPGIGRGIQPLSFFMNSLFGAGGSDVQSSAPTPFFFTDDWLGYFLDTCSVSFLDFTDPSELAWDVNVGQLNLYLMCQNNPADVVSQYTERIGRMRALPDWVHQGAIIGLQGGSQRLKAVHEALSSAKSAIAGYWLQDWVGQRRTSVGWQLWWNWELDQQHYPDWDTQRVELANQGIRLLSYVNPFLVDSAKKPRVRRDLFDEAKTKGFLVKSKAGTPYAIGNTSFNAYLVDLTNEAARQWLKSILVDQILGVGVHGFMADFGEALPADAQLHDGRDAAVHHNEYPIEWAKLIDEAIGEAGAQDIVAFHRSGYHRSPRFARLFWLGDQLISWHKQDGIKSAVTGLISGGLSGFSISHSDIGGYTSTDLLPLSIRLPGISFRRGRELLIRWIELNAFTPVFRTHEGNQPGQNIQIFDTPEMLSVFGYFSKVFAALFDYRKSEMSYVESRGWGLVRPVWFHHPEDEALLDIDHAFSLGRWLFVYPVTDKGRTSVDVRLPDGEYVHVFTKKRYDGGRLHTVRTPLYQPAVFIDASSPWCEVIISAVDEIDGPKTLTL